MKSYLFDAFIPNIVPSKINYQNIVRIEPFSSKKNIPKNSYRTSIIKNVVNVRMQLSNHSSQMQTYKQRVISELDDQVHNSTPSSQKLSSGNKKILSFLIFSGFFLTGYMINPFKSKLLTVAGSMVIGGVSYFALEKINVKKESNKVDQKIVEIICSDLDESQVNVNLNDLAKSEKMSLSEMQQSLSSVYKKFLLLFLRDGKPSIEELEILFKIKNLLGLSSQETGQCHFELAQSLYREYIVMLERESEEGNNMEIEKFFYFSDRIFSMDSKKGYQYESSRIRKIFLFSEEKVQNLCHKISINLLREKVASDITNLELENKNLKIFAGTIGIEENVFDAERLRLITQQIKEIFSSSEGALSSNEKRIEQLKKYFELNENQVSEIIYDIVSEDYLKMVTKTFNEILDVDNSQKETELVNNMVMYSKNILLSNSQIEKLFFSSLKNKVGDLIEKILMDSRGSTRGDNLDSVEKLIKFEEKFKLFSGILTSGNEPESLKLFNESLEAEIKKRKETEIDEIVKVYIGAFSNDIHEIRSNQGKFEKLANLIKLPGNRFESILKEMESPIFKQFIQKIIDSETDVSTAAQNISEMEKEFSLKSKAKTVVKISIYRENLEKKISEGVILKNEDVQGLTALKKILSLGWEDVQKVHDVLYEPVFKKSVLEAMGATGIIPSNYWSGLEKLRIRLQLTETKAKNIFYSAVQEKLNQIFEKSLFDAENSNSKNNENKDKGEDPTINPGSGTALGIEAGEQNTNELFNIVDIYFRNYIYIEDNAEVKDSKKTIIKGLSGRRESMNTLKIDTKLSYPVNLGGIVDKKKAEEVYKKYVIDCFSAKTQSDKRRLFNKLDSLGPILGLKPEQIKNIHSGVGEIIFKRYLGQALQKGFMDNQDNKFLASIQSTLTMDPRKSANIIKESKKTFVGLEIERVFASPKVDSTRVSKIRSMTDQLGVNLTEDIGVSQDQRARMFRVELDSSITGGKIDNNNQDEILRIQESFGIPDQEAKKIFLNCVNTRSEEHLVNSIASLRKSSNEEVLSEIEKMLSFGQLLPVSISTSFGSKNEKTKLIEIYQNFGNKEGKSEKVDLLKKMLDV